MAELRELNGSTVRPGTIIFRAVAGRLHLQYSVVKWGYCCPLLLERRHPCHVRIGRHDGKQLLSFGRVVLYIDPDKRLLYCKQPGGGFAITTITQLITSAKASAKAAK